MRKFIVTAGALVFIGLAPCFADDALDILARSDATLFKAEGRWTMSIEDLDGTTVKTRYVFSCLAGGVDRFLLVSTEPPVMRGQAILRLGDIIYQYIRKIDKLNQVAASQAFFSSTFSMEDVVSTQLAQFYTILKLDESVLDGKPCHVLTLEAKDSKVAYRRILCYIEKKTMIPLQREYFAYSGTLVKRLSFNEQRNGPTGQLEYLRLTMYDVLRPRYSSSVIFRDFDYSTPVKDTMFTLPYMKQAAR